MASKLIKSIALIAIFVIASLSSYAQTSIIANTSAWKYLSNGSNQGTAWRTTSFSDATWSQGAAPLGFGNPSTTTLTSGKITYYFRKVVSISTASFSNYTMQIKRDDGIVVYINGTEVYRNNMPSGTISYTTKASTACSDDGTSTFTIALPASYFINGNNTIAAEVHNNSKSSSDITFQLSLAGNTVTTTCATPNLALFGTLNITSTSASPYWAAVSGALSYNVEYRIRNIGASYSSPLSTNVTSITLSNLQPSTNYEFIVQTVCSAGSSAYSSSGWFTTPSGPVAGGGVPLFNKIVIVIGENTNASAVFGSSDAPYINALASAGAKFTNSYALTHPSQPNYLMLFSGSNQGVTNDNMPGSHFTSVNLAKELLNAGKTFISYSEGLPSAGSDVNSSGLYQRKHNPVANWMGTSTNQVPTSLNQPFSSFPTNFSNLPSVSFVIPNMCNDGHDVCPPYNNRTKQYDAWIENNLNAYKQWCINNNSILIVTYDEDDFTTTNKISTVFYGANVLVGQYTQTINHYSVLRTVEEAMGLTTHAGAAASASPINFCWVTPIAARSAFSHEQLSDIKIYPNPTNSMVNIELNASESSHFYIRIFDINGKLCVIKPVDLPQGSTIIQMSVEEINNGVSGLYFVSILNNDQLYSYNLVIE